MLNIRNFAIIAHIDHGKSTLADRILEITHAVNTSVDNKQLLDSMDLEKERGITIKLKAISLHYTLNNTEYLLNLIDTPGHVDFSYEVSRSLSACEGAVLLVDATKGVQAQTIANLNHALDENLAIIPVVNKIDAPGAEVDRTIRELQGLGFLDKEILQVSAKTGTNVIELIEEIIKRVPPPTPTQADINRALVFDSLYDLYKGVVTAVKVVDGEFKKGDKIKFLATNADTEILSIYKLTPLVKEVDTLASGEVGFFVTALKTIENARVGDTITHKNQSPEALPGYKPAFPVVYLSLYPIDPSDFLPLREAMGKLKLNDYALEYTAESSPSLGQGFRCGFLGLLHSEITIERLSREYNLDLIATSPSVNYKLLDGTEISKTSQLPASTMEILEPIATVEIIAPSLYLGPIGELIHTKRGVQLAVENLADQIKATYKIPLSEIITDFYDELKSRTQGYASLNFEVTSYESVVVSKLEIYINNDPLDALAQIVPSSRAESSGRATALKLKEVLPRQQFSLPIQAIVGGKIIARETVPAFRKDVTAKLYGGDVTRKNKLLDKQKKGKKRLKSIGNIQISQEVFTALLRK